jgi:excisionase family DNA binding protein
MLADDPVVTAQELATELGVHERSVRRWITQGKLHAKKRGNAFAIRRSDAETLVGTSLSRRVASRAATADREVEFLLLQGRYQELCERVEALERELADERRRSARLELQLEMRTAA